MGEQYKNNEVIKVDPVTGKLTTLANEVGEDKDKGSILESIINLFKVKSLVTVSLTAVFGYLAITEKVDAQQFMSIFTTIIAFYFGVQTMKEKE